MAYRRTSDGKIHSIQRSSCCFCRPEERNEIGSAMKGKNLIQPAVRTMESVPADDVSPHSSAIVGVTLLGDVEDVLAVLRTAVLLARNLRASLSLSLPGRDVLPVELGQTPCSTVSELLDFTSAQLNRMAATTFAMEVNIVAASFVCTGAITMRVRTANAFLERQQVN